jgi:hypothetical protein
MRRGARNVPSDEMVLQSVNDIFVDNFFTMGIGGYVSWPNRRQLIVSFGYNPTITSKTFVELRKYRIASAFDPYAFSEGIFLPDPIPQSRKPATTAVIDAPRRLSYCTDFTVDGLVSSGGVGRDLTYVWDVAVHDANGMSVNEPWVRRLQSNVSHHSKPTIRVTSPDSRGDFTSCFAGSNEDCNFKPGYTYIWRLITYSWLFDGELAECGGQGDDSDEWSLVQAYEDPSSFVDCPATSFKSFPSYTECYKNDTDAVRRCQPWDTAQTEILDYPFPDLQILGPSTIIIQPMTSLHLQGSLNLESLFTCDFNNPNAQDGATKDGILGEGAAGELLGRFQNS